MSTQTKPEIENAQLKYNVTIIRLKKLYKLVDKLRLAQLGTDRESRVEYRYMEKQALEEVEKTKQAADELIKKYNVKHSFKDFLKNV
jgi:hypothetical protein